ncbi:hypothetical protein [Metabacillus mangrovi]|uniref:hypothetical protein n=1 Tax=Metabacillus mangrovi TaxID=1491830 RepID=UPI0013DDEE91|nr:hypothetical protein [Metabacillus mangrovi]
MKPFAAAAFIVLFAGAFLLQVLGLMNMVPLIFSSALLFAVFAGIIYYFTRKKIFKGY